MEGVHQAIPDTPPANQPVYHRRAAAGHRAARITPRRAAGRPAGTEADKLRAQYKDIGDAQGHKFGEGTPGSKPPDFNLKTRCRRPRRGRSPAAPAAPSPSLRRHGRHRPRGA